ncbi:MAG: hypothetical protein WC861_04150 [Candidatus Micrarchaeia archaeon]|jgi:hypothetical protein
MLKIVKPETRTDSQKAFLKLAKTAWPQPFQKTISEFFEFRTIRAGEIAKNSANGSNRQLRWRAKEERRNFKWLNAAESLAKLYMKTGKPGKAGDIYDKMAYNMGALAMEAKFSGKRAAADDIAASGTMKLDYHVLAGNAHIKAGDYSKAVNSYVSARPFAEGDAAFRLNLKLCAVYLLSVEDVKQEVDDYVVFAARIEAAGNALGVAIANAPDKVKKRLG